MSLRDLGNRATFALGETQKLNAELAKTPGLSAGAQAPSGGGGAPIGSGIDAEAFGVLTDLVRGIDAKVTQPVGAAVEARRFQE